uniref:HAT C-terminal dimerisation domain-containing protein n=1 Tax=Octopus bimaculoides TaxID=37653 RepID=A0A0L8HX96_OCTBM
MIHREALATTKLAQDIKIINFIKSLTLNRHLFSNFCKDIDSECKKLLLHAEKHIDDNNHLPYKAQEEFVELSSDSNLKLEFTKRSFIEFWFGAEAEFPTISEMALHVLFSVSFSTTYLCETTFLVALTLIKIKYLSTLKNVEDALRPAMSNIRPRFNLLYSKKQTHPSH